MKQNSNEKKVEKALEKNKEVLDFIQNEYDRRIFIRKQQTVNK